MKPTAGLWLRRLQGLSLSLMETVGKRQGYGSSARQGYDYRDTVLASQIDHFSDGVTQSLWTQDISIEYLSTDSIMLSDSWTRAITEKMQISIQQYPLGEVAYRISSMEWDLRGEFQRREVWTTKKKQRLIDTILRGWQIPSIHLLRSGRHGQVTVLDGQQRLVAIRDFMDGAFRVNGEIAPINNAVNSLNGLAFPQFPSWARHELTNYTIAVVFVDDYSPEEVAELFYRLNQGTRLTAAEHRNAFHGPVGKQIKEIAQEFESLSGDGHYFGISNLRMAYDDVLAHLANTLIEGTLWSRVNSSSLSEMYKSKEPLPIQIVHTLRGAIHAFSPALRNNHPDVRFGKASIFSWLLFAVRANSSGLIAPDSIHLFVHDFETARQSKSEGFIHKRFQEISTNTQYAQLLRIFNHRCSSRITETSSVVLRDIAIWIFFAVVTEQLHWKTGQAEFLDSIHQIVELLERYKYVTEDVLLDTAEAIGWGERI